MSTSAVATVDLMSRPAVPPSDTPAPALLLTYPGSDRTQALDPERHEVAVVDPLMSAFTAVQHHWPAIVAHSGRVLVVAPASAALGDPQRPLDAAVTGGLISLVRSLAIELRRHGATANILFFRDSPEDPALPTMIAALLDESAHAVTGQEIYAADDLGLGKLRP